MEFDDLYNMDGDFIPGIYNYCDAWCERCLYVDRCRNFASRKVIEREIEAKEKRKKSIEENKNFWNQVNRTIEDAAEIIDEEFPLTKGNYDFLFVDSEYDEDSEEARMEHKEKRRKATNHYITKVADRYENSTHKWFEDKKEILIQDYNSETEELVVSCPGIVKEWDIKQLTESVSLIRWYEMQIYVKIIRALSSNFAELEDADLSEGFPKDSDGSAMVALLGIDRSIGAWNILLGMLKEEKNNIWTIIKLLLWLRMEIEKTFPDARNFVWPPKV
ncbi:MAG: hypothetical protein H8E34_06365 [Bacteroidetes bacterium]|nr:hypothetical protein [Bacteroidota bacterium]